MGIPKRHFTATVVAVAGCSPVTFRAWRNRNGLFPESQGASGWNEFSDADIAAVRMVVVLTNLGIGAQMAVDVAMRALPTFENAFESVRSGNAQSLMAVPLVAVIDQTEQEPDPEFLFVSGFESVASVLRRVAYGTAVMVDLLEVISHVTDELRDGDYPTLAPLGTDLKSMAQVLADVFDPEKNPPKYDDEPAELPTSTPQKSRSSAKRRKRKGRK